MENSNTQYIVLWKLGIHRIHRIHLMAILRIPCLAGRDILHVIALSLSLSLSLSHLMSMADVIALSSASTQRAAVQLWSLSAGIPISPSFLASATPPGLRTCAVVVLRVGKRRSLFFRANSITRQNRLRGERERERERERGGKSFTT